MGRRMTVAVCLALGLLATPGAALADPPWRVPDVPGGWSDQARGDVCRHRGEPPCHTTTTASHPSTTVAGTSANATTTTTDVSGTSATATSTGTDVSGTSANSTTSGVSGTSGASATSAVSATSGVHATTTTALLHATASAGQPPARPSSSSAGHALAHTGAAPVWTGVGGLVALLAGSALLVFGRRRRA